MPDQPRKMSALQSKIARQILDYIRDNELSVGHHLTEESFAAQFGVSRTPVRHTLSFLAEAGILELIPNRGLFLAKHWNDIDAGDLDIPDSAEDELHAQILRDRISGKLNGQHTETELMRAYSVQRGALTRVLWRLAKEGVIERSAGIGWTFLESLESPEAHSASYRLRLLIEPAAFAEPDYTLDRERLAGCRALHESLLRKGLERATAIEWFEANSEFHEMIACFSRNPHFLNIIQQQNRLRRIREYDVRDNDRMAHSCREHLSIMTAMESDDRPLAALILRRHLEEASDFVAREWEELPGISPA